MLRYSISKAKIVKKLKMFHNLHVKIYNLSLSVLVLLDSFKNEKQEKVKMTKCPLVDRWDISSISISTMQQSIRLAPLSQNKKAIVLKSLQYSYLPVKQNWKDHLFITELVHLPF